MKILDTLKAAFGMGSGVSWAEARDGKYFADPDKMYPLYLEKLGVAEPDQYWLEIARRCATEDLLKIAGGSLHLVILQKGREWALKNFPEGLGANAGATGFRVHYNKLLGG